MCYFITLGVNKDKVDTIKEIIRRQYSLSQSQNESLLSAFGQEKVGLEVTSGMCSCDLYSKWIDIEDEVEKIRRKYAKPKYRKQGWTQAKIDQAVQEALSRHRTGSGLDPGLRQTIDEIANQVGPVTLIVHWYRGNVQTESVPLHFKRLVTCQELLESDHIVSEDVLLEVSASSGR